MSKVTVSKVAQGFHWLRGLALPHPSAHTTLEEGTSFFSRWSSNDLVQEESDDKKP